MDLPTHPRLSWLFISYFRGVPLRSVSLNDPFTNVINTLNLEDFLSGTLRSTFVTLALVKPQCPVKCRNIAFIKKIFFVVCDKGSRIYSN